MKQQSTNFLDWCTKHATEKACKETLARQALARRIHLPEVRSRARLPT